MPFIKNALLPNVNVFALVNTVGLYNVFGTAFVDVVQFKYPAVGRRAQPSASRCTTGRPRPTKSAPGWNCSRPRTPLVRTQEPD